MTRDQKTVGIGAASGVVAMIISIAGIYELWPINPGLADISRRLAFALQANAFAALPLLIGVLTVGNNRFLSEAIDPTLQKEDLATQINGRVVENTLQQFALFLQGPADGRGFRRQAPRGLSLSAYKMSGGEFCGGPS